MKKCIILFVVMLCITMIFSDGWVEIKNPHQGEKFCVGETIDFRIDAIAQLGLFGDFGKYYMRYSHGSPLYGDCRYSGNRPHHGFDIACCEATYDTFPCTKPIYAPMCGKVTIDTFFGARCDTVDTFIINTTVSPPDSIDTTLYKAHGNYGKVLGIYYPSMGKTVFYAHLDIGYVTENSIVCGGLHIADCGNSGRLDPDPCGCVVPEYNYHIHLEMADSEQTTWKDFKDNRVDPTTSIFDNTLDSLKYELRDAFGDLYDYATWTEISSQNFTPSHSNSYPCTIELDSFNTNFSKNDLPGPTSGETVCKEYEVSAYVYGSKDTVSCERCQAYFDSISNGLRPSYPEHRSEKIAENQTTFHVCDCRLVILPTFSTVDVRVMDIYDYPADDPCERASAPIAALGFGTRGNWSAVSHTIRQRWPEPFKCYYAEGIIIGTPGYAVEC